MAAWDHPRWAKNILLDTINELKIYTLFYTVQKFAGDYLHMTFPLIYSLDYIPKTEEEDIVFTLAMVIVEIFILKSQDHHDFNPRQRTQ